MSWSCSSILLLTLAAGCHTEPAPPTTTMTAAVAAPATVETRPERQPAQQVAPAPEPVYTPFEGAHCPEWHELAIQAGWQVDELRRLDHVMWRESRCQPDAHNKADPMTGSRGLVQINGFWCLRSRWEPHPAGYLGARNILNSCDDLFDPLTNLTAGRAVFDYGLDRGQCPWGPWSTKGSGWC